MAPRSSATTFNPASVNSFARMPPVQPSPTMTASISFNFVTMSPSLERFALYISLLWRMIFSEKSAAFRDHALAHVRDADGIAGEFLVAVLLDVLPMHCDRAGESDQ